MADHDESAPEPEARTVVKNALALSRRRPFRLGLIVGALVTVAAGILVVQNGESAQFDWLAFHFSAPLWIILFVTMIAGGVTWEVLRILIRRGRDRSKQRRELAKQSKAL